MTNQNFRASILRLLKWALLLLLVGLAAGTLSALFLASLSWATDFRTQHGWMLYLLPAAGLLIGLTYHYWGRDVERGNHLVLDQIHYAERPVDQTTKPAGQTAEIQRAGTIPFKMAPMVLIATLMTHLFGGSAGREGTALQLSAASADQLTCFFKLNGEERMVLLIAALSAGFASVFGTPLAGAIFGLEVLLIRKFPYKAILPTIVTAYLGTCVTEWWGVGHVHYAVEWVPGLSVRTLAASFLAGIAFGVAAILFIYLKSYLTVQFKRIKYPPLRPVLGGVLLVVVVLGIGGDKYLGLGIPFIVNAFESAAPGQDFALKILLTAITLSAGFKGGEVTPLFFIGATLGSALSAILPLPVGVLAAMGFVAVFAGASKTPLACCAMAVELFGPSCLPFVLVACVTAYYLSGRKGIYEAEENITPSHFLFRRSWWPC